MGRDQTVRWRLREATAAAHERVDAAFSRFEWTSLAGYARFLQAQAQALLPLEAALSAGAAPGLGLGWDERRRGPALLADLAALGAVAPVGDDGLTPIAQPAAALGTIYVLEGSRLGGSLIKRSLPPQFPASFLAPGPADGWRLLLDVLERRLAGAAPLDEAIAAARATFDRFESSALTHALKDA